MLLLSSGFTVAYVVSSLARLVNFGVSPSVSVEFSLLLQRT